MARIRIRSLTGKPHLVGPYLASHTLEHALVIDEAHAPKALPQLVKDGHVKVMPVVDAAPATPAPPVAEEPTVAEAPPEMVEPPVPEEPKAEEAPPEEPKPRRRRRKKKATEETGD